MNKPLKLIFKILGSLLILAVVIALIVIGIKQELWYWEWAIGLPAPWNIVVFVSSALLFVFILVVILSNWITTSKVELKDKEYKSTKTSDS